MHRNSIYLIETGITKEVAHEHAISLAGALGVRPDDLGLSIRPAEPTAPRSVAFRRLSPGQRKFIDDLMSLPPDEFEEMQAAFDALVAKRTKRRRNK